MGDPRKQRRKYETPRFPWRIDILQAELRLVGQYGLRNKRELWRHETMLSKFRGIARSILGMPEEKVHVMQIFLGGGFGGKSRSFQAHEAARLGYGSSS